LLHTELSRAEDGIIISMTKERHNHRFPKRACDERCEQNREILTGVVDVREWRSPPLRCLLDMRWFTVH